MSENIYCIAPEDQFANFFDTFCGGGGSGSGILKAYDRLGIRPNGTFVNHWDAAIEIHSANHPEHRHFKEDLFLLDPTEYMPKQRYGLGWSSPSCQQFSISRGNRPINEQGRSHADTVVEWMVHCMPEVQYVENVKEFLAWGRLRQRRCKKSGELLWAMEVPGKKKGNTKVTTFPVLDLEHLRQKGEPEAEWELRMLGLGYDRHLEPDPAHKGEYFQAWIKRIEALGYMSDYRLLRSADYGDPTIRHRLFVQFVRIDTGKRIVWPDQRFIKPGAKRPTFTKNHDRYLAPWPTARNNVIDWSHKGTSIFTGRKPLAKATMRRIAIGLVKFGLRDFFVAQPFMVPKDQGHLGDYVTGVDQPVCTVQTTSVDHLAEPCVIQLNGQSTAIITDSPLGAVTGTQTQYVMEPHISHLRNGDGNSGVNAPLGALTAAGQHQLLTEAFLMVMDNAGKGGDNQRAFSADEPIKTVVTKANHTMAAPQVEEIQDTAVKFSLETLEDAVRKLAPAGVDPGRVIALLDPLMTELKKLGRVDVRPWVYVYYSNGAVGSDIDAPVPTIRCKEATAICYPVLEIDGNHMLLDVLYRMLSVKELQKAQGFPPNFKWPAGITKTDIVKAIGNSVSCGVAEALTLAWYTQDEDIARFFKEVEVAA